MTLYTKTGRTFRPATQSEILSAYGSLMAGRRKAKGGGSSSRISESGKKEICEVLRDAERSQRASLINTLARRYGVSTRTIYRTMTDSGDVTA